jgi:hypothetical protein
LQFQRPALAPGGHPGQAGFHLPARDAGQAGRAPSDLRATDADHYGLPASGTGEDVIKHVGDNISSWLATHE